MRTLTTVALMLTLTMPASAMLLDEVRRSLRSTKTQGAEPCGPPPESASAGPRLSNFLPLWLGLALALARTYIPEGMPDI